MDQRDDAHTTRKDDTVKVKLSCAGLGTFNGHSDKWMTFKENIQSEAGVSGYS
jgi:hypothetical protein